MKKILVMAVSLVLSISLLSSTCSAVSQEKSLTIPSNGGTITANAWRSTSASISGNTYQWDYQVSSVYSGSRTVERIRCTWKASASLRYSGSLTMSISSGTTVAVSAGASSTWQTTTTPEKYWENNNGSKTAWERSNIVVSPSKDYRSGTVAVYSNASVKVSKDSKTYTINAAV